MSDTVLPFLSGGGEMGMRTREYEWSETPVGDPATWPQSLRTTVSILLNSKFPMFLWWGNSLIQFYNDAYRPSLGNNGKHPTALGQRGEECWPEIWPTIKPLIDQVLNGEASDLLEDQLIPIYRNNRLEDVYWTFNYNPVYDDSGIPTGVLVVCNETTEKVKSKLLLEESKDQLVFAIEAAELGTFDYNPVTDQFSANHRLKSWFGLEPDEDIALVKAMDSIKAEDRQRVISAISFALDYRSGGQYDIEYAIQNPVTGDTRIVCAKGRAWFDANNCAYRFTGTVQDVAEKRKAEELQLKLLAIISNSEEFIGLARVTGEAEYVNPAGLKLLGWDDYSGKKILDCVFPEDIVFAHELISRLLTEGHFSEEIRFVNANTGTPFWIQWNGIAIKDPVTGEVISLATVSPDITQRKKTEQALAESEMNLRTVIENAPFPIGVYVGRDMRILVANQAIINTFGKGPAVIGKKYSEVLPELEHQEVFRQLDEVYTTGVPFHARNQRIDLIENGKLNIHYFNYSFTPLFDQQGRVFGVMNTGAELTDLVLAKQQLEETSAAWKEAVELAELATWSLNLKEQTVSYSPRFLEWTGITESTQTFAKADNQVPESHRKELNDALLAAISAGAGGSYNLEHPLVNKLTGRERIIHAQGRVIVDEEGNPAFLNGSAHDITDQRRRQEKLEQEVQARTAELAEQAKELELINNQLSQSNEELAQYAYVASHDLQEPLRKISIFTSMLERTSNTGEENTMLIKKISQSAGRMSSLIQGLLEFSRLLKSETLMKSVDLNQVMHSVLGDFELSIAEKNAIVHTDKLPRIEGVMLQLNQLFYNLISNALKFTQPEVVPEIHLIVSRMDIKDVSLHIQNPMQNVKYYHIRIRDNGIGFDSKYSEPIFEVFKRLHTRDVYPGSGIGLALCRRIASNHNGKLYAESAPGVGTTFHLVIPEKQSPIHQH